MRPRENSTSEKLRKLRVDELRRVINESRAAEKSKANTQACIQKMHDFKQAEKAGRIALEQEARDATTFLALMINQVNYDARFVNTQKLMKEQSDRTDALIAQLQSRKGFYNPAPPLKLTAEITYRDNLDPKKRAEITRMRRERMAWRKYHPKQPPVPPCVAARKPMLPDKNNKPTTIKQQPYRLFCQKKPMLPEAARGQISTLESLQ